MDLVGGEVMEKRKERKERKGGGGREISTTNVMFF